MFLKLRKTNKLYLEIHFLLLFHPASPPPSRGLRPNFLKLIIRCLKTARIKKRPCSTFILIVRIWLLKQRMDEHNTKYTFENAPRHFRYINLFQR